MDKEEVVMRLKEHLKGKKWDRGRVTNVDKNYCIKYIMDFLFYDRKTAKKIFETEVLI